MNIRFFALAAALAFLAPCRPAFAQITAKTLDSILEIHPDGSADVTFQLAFDAEPWQRWKAQVGDDPARLRGVMRHQFSAYVIDDFKFEKDDLNRTAKVVIHSPAGPELRKDQRFQTPVEGWCRLINHVGRDWFFSGNNPSAGYGLNTMKIVLPENTVDASLINAGTPDQTLVYALSVPAGRSRFFVWSGVVVVLAGAVLLVTGLRTKGVSPVPPASAPPPPAA